MRELTLKQVREAHGGILPNDAVLRPDDDEQRPAPGAGRSARAANGEQRAGRPANRGRAGRFATLNAFVDFGMSALTGAEAKVWLILFRDTKATGVARTGQADLARRAGLSRQAVKLTVRALQAKGFLRVVQRGRLSTGPSVYRVDPTGSSVPMG